MGWGEGEGGGEERVGRGFSKQRKPEAIGRKSGNYVIFTKKHSVGIHFGRGWGTGTQCALSGIRGAETGRQCAGRGIQGEGSGMQGARSVIQGAGSGVRGAGSGTFRKFRPLPPNRDQWIMQVDGRFELEASIALLLALICLCLLAFV